MNSYGVNVLCADSLGPAGRKCHEVQREIDSEIPVFYSVSIPHYLQLLLGPFIKLVG